MTKPETKTTKILLVEDDAFTVALASDGEKGLKTALVELPDIILLDIILPKMSGFDVLKNLKADIKTKPIPVILLTNLGQRDDVQKGLDLGAVDYLIKAHFMPSEVVEKIKKLVNK